MIRFKEVSKSYQSPNGMLTVLRRITHDFVPGEHTAVMGVNGAGKSTLLRLLSGAENPDSGQIERYGTVSWPLGFRGGLHKRMNGRELVAFVSRIYGEDYHRVLDFVERFSELGEFMKAESGTYSTGMKARLSFGISMAMDFDYYLIDEVIAVGDTDFKQKCKKHLQLKMENSTVIFVSHNTNVLADFCNTGLVLKGGDAHRFDDLAQATKFYRAR